MNYRICTKTVMDTSDTEIFFDEYGISNHWYEYKKKEKTLIYNKSSTHFESIIKKIKGNKKKYNCLIGLSGGVDSSYIAHLAGKNELNPLIVHFDNGWNSELSVYNIEKIINKYNFDLYTVVVDWEEFKDLQLSFFKASVPNIEIPTDHAIIATLYKIARKYKIKYILSGSNIATEGILPRSWGYDASDYSHIKHIHKKFGKKSLKSYPKLTLTSLFVSKFIYRIRKVNILNLIDYNKEKAIQELSDEIGWRKYDGKHYESIFTQFFQAYVLPKKFGIDKRRAHFSTLICSGQMAREEALLKLNEPLYNPIQLKEHIDFICKKFSINETELNSLMNSEPKSHELYYSNKKIFDLLRSLSIKFKKILKK